MTARNETMWCTACGARFTQDEIKGWGCPKCGDEGVPCGTDRDVKIEVNWHELHILCVWAENFAQSCFEKDPASNKKMPTVVTAIARRLQSQFPQFSPLTLSGEIADLPAALQKSGIKIGSMESTIPRPKPIAVNGPGAVGYGINRDAGEAAMRSALEAVKHGAEYPDELGDIIDAALSAAKREP